MIDSKPDFKLSLVVMKIRCVDAWCFNSLFDFIVAHLRPRQLWSFERYLNNTETSKSIHRYRCWAPPIYLSGKLRAGLQLSSWSWQNVEDRSRCIINCRNLVISNKLIKVELPPWKIWMAEVRANRRIAGIVGLYEGFEELIQWTVFERHMFEFRCHNADVINKRRRRDQQKNFSSLLFLLLSLALQKSRQSCASLRNSNILYNDSPCCKI